MTIIILGQWFWFGVQQGVSFMEQQLISTIESFENVRTWSEARQCQDKDILMFDYVSEMHEEVKIDFHQNDYRELKHIWDNWDINMKEAFAKRYEDIAVLRRV